MDATQIAQLEIRMGRQFAGKRLYSIWRNFLGLSELLRHRSCANVPAR